MILERLLLDFPGTTITVLVRSQTSATAVERVHYLTRKPAFDVLRQRLGGDEQLLALLDERVTVIDGDFTRGGPELPSGIDVAIHSAAAVSFDPPIQEAFQTNLFVRGGRASAHATGRKLEGGSDFRPLPALAGNARVVTGGRGEQVLDRGQPLHPLVEDERPAVVLRPGGTFRFLVYRRWALQTLVFAAGHALRPLAKRRLGSDRAVGRKTASIAEFTLLPVVHLFPEQTWLREVRRNGMQIEHVERRDAWFPLDRAIPGLAKSDSLSEQLGRFLIVEAHKAA